MKLDEVARALGYADIDQLERNIDGYGEPLVKWWNVIQDVVNNLPLNNAKTPLPSGDEIWLKAQETSRFNFEEWYDNLANSADNSGVLELRDRASYCPDCGCSMSLDYAGDYACDNEECDYERRTQ